MEITRSGSVATRRLSRDTVTGLALADTIVRTPGPSRLQASHVTFEPGARSAWHTHPLGQALHVTAGVGRVQAWGEQIREVKGGDTVWIWPGEKHWHGAGPTTAMSHIAIHEVLDGSFATWMEPVSDTDYAGLEG